MNAKPVLKRGALAYYDTLFSGMIPCKVLRVYPGERGPRVDVQVTGDRKPYSKGERISDMNSRDIVPRGAVYRSRQRCGQWMIRPYDIEVDA